MHIAKLKNKKLKQGFHPPQFWQIPCCLLALCESFIYLQNFLFLVS